MEGLSRFVFRHSKQIQILLTYVSEPLISILGCLSIACFNTHFKISPTDTAAIKSYTITILECIAILSEMAYITIVKHV